MREILFKAKRLDNGEWFEGVPVDVTPLTCFASDKVSKEVVMVRAGFADWDMPRALEYTKVDPSTVCQYTGQVDYESEEPIFCDDLLKSQNGMEHIYVVGFENGGYFARERGETRIGTPLTIENIGWLMLKRIGSIHDGEGGQHEGNE